MATKTVPETEQSTFCNYIGGEWLPSDSGKTFEQRNPARLSEVTGNFPASTPEDTKRAISCAESAYEQWRGTPPPVRAEILTYAAYAGHVGIVYSTSEFLGEQMVPHM